MKRQQRPVCPYCGKPAQLVSGKQIYPHRKDLFKKRFWSCEPCKACVGCHQSSAIPLGRLANAELRVEKSKAHAEFDPVWKEGWMTRAEAYKRLSHRRV